MDQLLGIRLETAANFKEGWRQVPVNVERQVLFLLVQKHAAAGKTARCREDTNWPEEKREKMSRLGVQSPYSVRVDQWMRNDI